MGVSGLQRLGLLIILLQVAPALAQTKVLVLLEDLAIRNTHSEYFQSLIEAGNSLDFRLAESKGLRLREWDDWLYAKLIIFAPSVAGAWRPRTGPCAVDRHAGSQQM